MQPALTAVCEDRVKKGLSAEDIENVRKTIVANKVYEKQGNASTFISMMSGLKNKSSIGKKGVVKESDVNQNDATKDKRQKTKDKRATVHNTVAGIEHTGKGFTLPPACAWREILRFVLAFLLNNVLLGLNIKFCTDGQRGLQDAIVFFFSWHKHLSLLMDWFHRVKKFKEGLSLACKGHS